MLLALLLASDETIRVVGDRVRRQGLSGSTARNAAAEMIKRGMEWMFHGAKSFNQSLSAWRVDNVTDMIEMFKYAESFNQPLSDWQVNSVADITNMFWGASAFDQDLGWCVDDNDDDYDYDDDSCLNCGPLDLDDAFNGTKCESTSCGVSICNTDAAPARRISVAAAVAALVSVLIA